MALPAENPVSSLIDRAMRGERKAIAKLISIVEDGSPEIGEVMKAIFPHTGTAHTLGITGAPGAGKSTLTEALLGKMRADGNRVAVLAVDPSSPFSGGALLGDRVRMQTHATDQEVFIRSMATRGHLGGLSLATPEAIRVLDAVGNDYIVVETVGVGQAEVEIVETADTTVVVVTPGWGDSVQAGKAGLLEIADIFVVNKADREGASQAVRDLKQAIGMGTHAEGSWRPPVLQTVATESKGIDELWSSIKTHREHLATSGELETRRKTRIAREVSEIVAERVVMRVKHEASEALAESVERVLRREIDPYAAAEGLLSKLENNGI